MRVFRVEHKETKGGPYRIPMGSWTNRDHDRIDGHPAPCDESYIRSSDSKMEDIALKTICDAFSYFSIRDNELIFGFKSMEQLHQWFDFNELWKLANAGHTIRVFEASSWIELEKQIMFIRGDYIEEISIEEILEKLTQPD